MVQTIKVAMMPIGRSFCGLRHSSAAVETESNPIYVKNTIDAPVRIPGNPCGANGCQLALLMARAEPKQNSRIAPILMSTMVVFASALSLTPRTSTTVTSSVMSSAGMLNMPAGPPAAGIGGYANCCGKCQPSRLSHRSCIYAENPTATDILETAYSKMRSQPMIQATISPRMAYA